jgi:basic membrane protein A and related proteins
MRRNLLGSAFALAAAGLLIGGSALAQSAAPAGSSTLKIGVVTDVGTLDDKNFNEFSWNGAVDGAKQIGAAEPQAIVTTASADYAKNIQTFVDQNYDVIVTIGFAIGNDTRAAAEKNPDIKFIGVDQFQCYAANPEDTTCSGDPLPNFQSIVFAEQQPGYLAGVVAASLSKTGTIAALGGSSTIPPVVSYLRGYQNGALSVKPDINVNLQYVSDDLTKAFNDPAGGTAFAEQFMQQVPDADIIFAAAGKTGNGMLQAICAAKAGGKDVWAIGVDVDQYLSTPDADPCLLTSAEKKLSSAVSQLIVAIANGTDQGGNAFFNASNQGIGLAPFYDAASLITPEIQSAIDAATKGLADGSIDACKPNACTP